MNSSSNILSGDPFESVRGITDKLIYRVHQVVWQLACQLSSQLTTDLTWSLPNYSTMSSHGEFVVGTPTRDINFPQRVTKTIEVVGVDEGNVNDSRINM